MAALFLSLEQLTGRVVAACLSPELPNLVRSGSTGLPWEKSSKWLVLGQSKEGGPEELHRLPSGASLLGFFRFPLDTPGKPCYSSAVEREVTAECPSCHNGVAVVACGRCKGSIVYHPMCLSTNDGVMMGDGPWKGYVICLGCLRDPHFVASNMRVFPPPDSGSMTRAS